jgi:hypothetical protein
LTEPGTLATSVNPAAGVGVASSLANSPVTSPNQTLIPTMIMPRTVIKVDCLVRLVVDLRFVICVTLLVQM